VQIEGENVNRYENLVIMIYSGFQPGDPEVPGGRNRR
jgi:hypothetical protein